MSQQTVAHAFAALMNGHDPDAVDGFVAEDYVNHNPYVEDGREANRAFWGRWFAAFPDTRVTLEDVLVDSDRVVGRFTYRATHLGSLLGEEPTGRPVEMRSLDIWRVRDGMAVEHWDELNTVEFFTQLGLLAPMNMPGAPAGARSREEGDAS
ncbi:ester cyclase [Streptomyces triculaminicus]|uniref:Ester cyclase n=2 Tax=Streptomyces TaxID=1883 RepID=A0A939FLU4_9ACTN|nr:MULTISPECIES: ester cyclase [Streptomyces]MBO0652893.1 ester cyclase [Streptomyces triculaminicus]QSY51391.1 ester cyclase [Streptomyces griseocarneus]